MEDKDYYEMKTLYRKGLSPKDIAIEMDIPVSVVFRAIRFYKWKRDDEVDDEK